jgi:phosphopantothenoylcysteine decarboxylase/phosphopantothenate--cysteine ligase
MGVLKPPTDSTMGDHDVPAESDLLQGKHIALLVSGGIAAIKAPLLARALRRFGAEVTAFVSPDALNYTTLTSLEWATTNPVVSKLTSDSEHLHKAAPFDAYLVAPATYNTLNKFATGVADGVLTTTLAAALGLRERGKAEIVVVPTMHGDMHNSILEENVDKLAAKGVHVMPPRDAYGKHNLPEPRDIVHYVCRALSRSPLKGVPVLVTAGPVPVEIDRVRILTNVFKGALGSSIAQHLWLLGANVELILGRDLVETNPNLPTTRVKSFQQYREAVKTKLAAKDFRYGVFAAAVADHEPTTVHPGKMPSSGENRAIELRPTPKVIDEVLSEFPKVKMISFKLEVGASLQDFRAIATERLRKGHLAVVTNELSRISTKSHLAHLFAHDGSERALEGRAAILKGISSVLEDNLTTLS